MGFGSTILSTAFRMGINLAYEAQEEMNQCNLVLEAVGEPSVLDSWETLIPLGKALAKESLTGRLSPAGVISPGFFLLFHLTSKHMRSN